MDFHSTSLILYTKSFYESRGFRKKVRKYFNKYSVFLQFPAISAPRRQRVSVIFCFFRQRLIFYLIFPIFIFAEKSSKISFFYHLLPEIFRLENTIFSLHSHFIIFYDNFILHNFPQKLTLRLWNFAKITQKSDKKTVILYR